MKARVIALYLPQYHPIPENDEWWGKGFTEWTNVAKAKPLFRGHYQPRIPADLGFYDLRIPEVREQQAELAKNAGIEGFCYYHYWFGNGKQLLERPFNEVLKSKKPHFPFCLCWANHSWTNKTWQKGRTLSEDKALVEQQYLGVDDYTKHFFSVLDAFKDHRYITVDGKPLFVIYDVMKFEDVSNFLSVWRKLALENGLKGIHFVGIANNAISKDLTKGGNQRSFFKTDQASSIYKYVLDKGFDAINSFGRFRAEACYQNRFVFSLKLFLKRKMKIPFLDTMDYSKLMKNFFVEEDKWENVYPTIFPQYDRSPRSGSLENVCINSTPENFTVHLKEAISLLEGKEKEHQILFLKSWNEWGEGNYVEPDLKFGSRYLDVLRDTLNN